MMKQNSKGIKNTTALFIWMVIAKQWLEFDMHSFFYVSFVSNNTSGHTQRDFEQNVCLLTMNASMLQGAHLFSLAISLPHGQGSHPHGIYAAAAPSSWGSHCASPGHTDNEIFLQGVLTVTEGPTLALGAHLGLQHSPSCPG